MCQGWVLSLRKTLWTIAMLTGHSTPVKHYAKFPGLGQRLLNKPQDFCAFAMHATPLMAVRCIRSGMLWLKEWLEIWAVPSLIYCAKSVCGKKLIQHSM